MAQKYFDEYLAVIRPSFDEDSWKTVGGKIDDAIGNPFKKLKEKWNESIKNFNVEKLKLDKLVKDKNDFLKRQSEGKLNANEVKDAENILKGFDESIKAQKGAVNQLSNFGGKVSAAAGYLQAFITALNMASDAAQDMAEKAVDASNQFVTQSSIFVNTDTRNLMGKFGVDAATAQSLGSVSEVLDINLSDYSKLTQGQRKAFADLMSYYQKGINSINPDKLKQFNEATQEYQLMQAKFNLDMKLALTELLAESDGVRLVLNTLSEGMEGVSNLMKNDAVKVSFDLLMGVINGILRLVTTPMNWLGSLFTSGNTTSTTTNTANVNTTVNTRTGIDANELALDIGMQVQNAMTRR